MMRRARLQLPVLAALGAWAAWASGTTAWEMNSYADFVRGRFSGISLSRDGRLTLAPRMETVFDAGEPVVWSVAEGPGGVLYLGTGHRGRVYRVDPSGRSALWWSAGEPEIFALAVDRSGAVYAATSPDGKVYRIENGKATEYFAPKAKYIWALAAGPAGELYVGTGDQGRIFRVTAAGQGEVYYETGQSHVTGLAVDAEGRLLAGSEPHGILYRITARDKAFVLYDSNLPEIRAIVPRPDGTVYAAALGGSLARRAQGAAQAQQSGATGPVVTSPTTTITVEAQAQQPGADIKPPGGEAARPQPVAGAAQVTTQFQPVTDTAGVEKSAVYRINPDNTVETLWSSKEENAYDILALENQLLIATDAGGRIYGIAPDRRVTLVAQTGDAETTRLLPSDNSILAATGNAGRVFRLGQSPGTEGSYEAPVHDAGTVARWGSLSWRADLPAGCRLEFHTRSGNSSRPDRTWSDWSAPLAASGLPVTSPNARYIQWRASLAGASAATPVLGGITLAYLPQNSAPVVKSIGVVTQAAPSAQAKAPSTQGSSAPYTVTVSDTGEAAPSASGGTPTQTLSRAAAQQIGISWQAEDPDGDRLVYTVYFRGDDETRWKLLKGDLHETTVVFDADALADGKYFFRVVASDREANPPATAREGQMVSAPVMIDNTPPAITVSVARRDGARAHIEFEAADAASPLRRCEYSLDARTWVPVQAADGVIDSPREKFVVTLDALAPGEHLLVLRVADSAGNTGLAKVVLR
jgi:sugar lactone lactonase YvrE